ncbi:MAG: ABC transporter substrate-binding protein [Acetobacteraceae bacterium]|nr:ABC transporter substrate-binding protein [Acetobacteraceae bacterium]
MSDETPSLAAKFFEPGFMQGLRDLDYTEGKNIPLERRYAEDQTTILPRLATELVKLQPDIIVAIGTPAARAAASVTQTIPIVFARIFDPISAGLASSLAHLGANLTGVTVETPDLAAKTLQLLVTAVPAAKRIGALWDPVSPYAGPLLGEIERAARSLNLELTPAEVDSPNDIEASLRSMAERHADALIVVPGLVLNEHSRRIAELAVQFRLPTMFSRRQHVEAGGLMSYGTNYTDMYRRAAAYVDKILKGAKPADLPVEQPTTFELVINLKTAKALGITVPLSMIQLADEVIE